MILKSQVTVTRNHTIRFSFEITFKQIKKKKPLICLLKISLNKNLSQFIKCTLHRQIALIH